MPVAAWLDVILYSREQLVKEYDANEELKTTKHTLAVGPYKNVETLARFISERGKIVPRRQTGVSAKNQRALTRAIKQARNTGLLPVVIK